MLIISGTPAISEFRKEKALRQIQKVLPKCTALEINFVYFADVSLELDSDHKNIFTNLLNLTGIDCQDNDFFETISGRRITVPRIGTISPWATKATDIFHHCGLGQVRKIERGIVWKFINEDGIEIPEDEMPETNKLSGLVFDPMTESILKSEQSASLLFDEEPPAPLNTVDLLRGGAENLKVANEEFGFALSTEEQSYLVDRFYSLKRNPTDVELMMFAQVNSEHCRHKIFNADWTIDGVDQPQSLFSMIRTTHKKNSVGTLTAYSDNAAALVGSQGERLAANPRNNVFEYTNEPIHFTAKVETHNHPTAISPFPGASTGSGGEIRDEGATGRGGKPKAGLVGYSVSHLRIPNLPQPWELPENKPQRIASPLQIMLEGPIGAAAFNNEFGRPNIAGYFRCFEENIKNHKQKGELRYGYHKPIMLAGGVGNIRPQHIEKKSIPDQTPIIVLGGPTMLIGLGGGAASSVAVGSSSEALDFASVQRGNPEMQRRCQEVIDVCCAMGDQNPILSIHDVGAGGLCNALPELVHDSESGGIFELRNVLNDEPGMSPMQIWCNESQERYVLAIKENQFDEFEKICKREKCLYTQVGFASSQQSLVLTDEHFKDKQGPNLDPIDLPMEVLFGLPPKMHRSINTGSDGGAENLGGSGNFTIGLEDSLEKVLSHPTVGDKTFLVTIGDRSVTGLITRDQMVGPWQVPIADVAVTAIGYRSHCGEGFAVGERTPVAVLDAPASGRMAIGEVITNLAAASIKNIKKIKLSANWMVAAGEPDQDANLFSTVKSIALDLCPQLGISIPVGKDSMSMKTVWRNDEEAEQRVIAPMSLVVSGFAAVSDVRNTLTPELKNISEPTNLWLIDLGGGKNRLGASVLDQVVDYIEDAPADLDDPEILKKFFSLIQKLNESNLLLSYHDRSDGGLITTLCEMAFVSRCGLEINLDSLVSSGNENECLSALFNEELGAVLQSRQTDFKTVSDLIESFGLQTLCHKIGEPVSGNEISISVNNKTVLRKQRTDCHRIWSQTTWQMQRMRDNPKCADQEYERILDTEDAGLFCELSFLHNHESSSQILSARKINIGVKPRVAILREQGVNGQMEMAAAFDAVGFEAVDVTMTDLSNGSSLDGFVGLAACGGFSYGDVLGAGEGWGKSILFNLKLKEQFENFFNRSDAFSLGVCNGCQMMSSIKSIIPGAQHWPRFLRNTSEQYEARLVMVEVCSEKSILFQGMQGSKFPVAIAHGEGKSTFNNLDSIADLEKNDQLCLRFVDNYGSSSDVYPYNANGSSAGLTGFTNSDGRITIMMTHPERVFRTVSNTWMSARTTSDNPYPWGEYSPWIQIFLNARKWVD